MSALRDPRMELFARELAAALNNGVAPSDAAVTAGDAAGYPRGRSATTFAANCRKRAQRDDIAARVAELRAPGIKRAEEAIGITTEYLLAKLQNFVEFNRADYLSAPDADGERHYTLKDVPPDLIGRTAALKINRFTTGRGKNRRVVAFVTDVDGHDPYRGIELMAKIKGLMAPEKREHEVGDTLAAVLKEIDGRTRGLPTGA